MKKSIFIGLFLTVFLISCSKESVVVQSPSASSDALAMGETINKLDLDFSNFVWVEYYDLNKATEMQKDLALYLEEVETELGHEANCDCYKTSNSIHIEKISSSRYSTKPHYRVSISGS